MGLFPSGQPGKRTPPPEQSPGVARTLLRYTWFVVLAAALVVGWMFFREWDENRRLVRQARGKQQQQDAREAEMLGGNRLSILAFYADPPALRRGQTSQLCYSVSNAKTVEIDPPAGHVWPSLTRCLDVRPSKTTTYTLTIEDGAGHRLWQSVTITVSN